MNTAQVGCGHCEHAVGMTTESLGYSVTDYVCCHCGRKRSERTYIGSHGPGYSWAWSDGGHGPHWIPPTPRWS